MTVSGPKSSDAGSSDAGSSDAGSSGTAAEPVANAEVKIGIDPSPLSFLPFFLENTITDPEGSFLLSFLPAGTYELSIRHPDFAPTTVRRELGDAPQELEISLERKQRYSLVGTLTSPDGEVAGVRLAFRRASRGSSSGPTLEAITDDSGRFVLDGLAAGGYEVRLPDDPRSLAPGSRRIVVEGPESLVIELAPTSTLHGSIRGLDPEQIAVLKVSERNSRQDATIDLAAETYRIEGLPSGAVRLMAAVLDPSTGEAALRVERYGSIPPGRQEAVLDLDFDQGVNLSGLVVRGQRPLVDARVSISGAIRSTSVQTDGEGRFAFPGLLPGRYTLDVFAQPSASGRKHDLVASRQIELEADRFVDIELPADVAVAGRVVDDRGAPLPDAVVAVLRTDSQRAIAEEVVTDPTGRFLTRDLPTGHWRLQVQKQGYASRVEAIEIDEQGLEVELELEPAESRAVRIVRTDGSAPESITIRLLDPQGRVLWSLATAPDAEGSVWLDSAPVGRHRLWIEADGGVFGAFEPGFEIPPRQESLRVQPSGGVSFSIRSLAEEATSPLEILDADGRPFAPHIVPKYLYSGQQEIPYLPAGRWSVLVRSGSGASQHHFRVEPGGWTHLELP